MIKWSFYRSGLVTEVVRLGCFTTTTTATSIITLLQLLLHTNKFGHDKANSSTSTAATSLRIPNCLSVILTYLLWTS